MKEDNTKLTQKTPLQIAQLIDDCVQQLGTVLTCLLPIDSPFYDRALKLRDLNNLSPDQIIEAIGQLPILPAGLEFPANDVAHKIVAKLRERYRYIRTYLKTAILEKQQCIDELDQFLSSGLIAPQIDSLIGNTPFVLLAFARYKLALAACSKSDTLKAIFGSGLILWACAEFSLSRLELRVRGVSGNPIIFGKTGLNEINTDAIGVYRSHKLQVVPPKELPEWRQQLHSSETLCQQFLDLQAACIAKDDAVFDLNHWQVYINTLTRIKELWDLPAYQCVYRISQTETFTTRKHGKIPQEFKPKGFVPRIQKQMKQHRNLKKVNRNR
jgi:hypothetical protein